MRWDVSLDAQYAVSKGFQGPKEVISSVAEVWLRADSLDNATETLRISCRARYSNQISQVGASEEYQITTVKGLSGKVAKIQGAMVVDGCRWS